MSISKVEKKKKKKGMVYPERGTPLACVSQYRQEPIKFDRLLV